METLNWAIRIFFNFRWNVNRICHQKNIYNVWKEQPFDTRASGCVKWIWFFSFVRASIRPFAMQGLRIGSSNFFFFFLHEGGDSQGRKSDGSRFLRKTDGPKTDVDRDLIHSCLIFYWRLKVLMVFLLSAKPTGLQKK